MSCVISGARSPGAGTSWNGWRNARPFHRTRIVVTSRPDRQLLQRFRLAQASQLREEQISPAAAEVFADLLTYAERLLSEMALEPSLAANGTNARLLARRAAARAQGSFLYLVMWGRALRQARDQGDKARIEALTDLAALPAGLDAIYEYFLVLLRDTVARREGPHWRQVWNVAYRPLLAVLAVAQAPLTIELLGLLTGRPGEHDRSARPLPTSRNSWTGTGREPGCATSALPST